MTILDAPLAARRLAGYRVLRSLARDAEAEVLLGYREGEAAGDGEAAASRPDVTVAGDTADAEIPATVALKVSEATPAGWAATVEVLEALERARGDHVVEVLDLETTDQFLCLVFERLPNGSLAELLALRGSLDAGEVVTIVAPVAAAVERMHAAGAAHGAVGARTVMFRCDGAPVLIGFGSSRLFPPGAPEVVLEREPGVAADRRALRDLSCLLLSRVAGTRGRAARVLVSELESCPDELIAPLLGRRLFDVAAARPVRFTVDDEGDAAGPEPTRIVPLGQPVGDEPDKVRGVPGIISRVIPEAWVQRVLDGVDGSPFAALVNAAARAWRGWSPGRRRVVLGVAVAMVAVSGALAVIPSSPPTTAGAAGSSRSAGALPVASSAASPGEMTRAVEGDDPLVAATALIIERERCLRSLSQLCLDGVDQSDGGVLRDDRATIRGAQQGDELPDPLVAMGNELAPELVERLGDSALVRLTLAASAGTTNAPTHAPTHRPADAPSSTSSPREPTSVLLVKGEAGWRIRELIASPTTRSAVSN